ncbi:polysaccharide biosynthesis/export family protein [Dendrosporobacter sp. 1207_IL3150]|uniref:polysaccharide biosynthesis/export family protein n=1 Tax=Dendrosporobacter sp. 1207_IL3150 TaxID=3084054 RepID=UPI002FDB1082
MKSFIKFILINLALVVIIPLNSVYAQDYCLDAGDILSVSVWGYEELQVKDLIIRPDGKIAFPLVGEISATGKSTFELTSILTRGLSEYVKDPKVTVNIAKYRTTRVYLLGQVTKPGMYEIEKQHNLLDAIGIAGGYTKDAAKKKVHIIRKDGEKIKANLLDILTKGDMSQNFALNDGDVVYLSDNGRIDFAKDILPWISATYQVSRIDE